MNCRPSCTALFGFAKLVVLTVLLCAATRSADAVVTIAGIDFEDDAFADVLLSYAGSIVAVGPPGSTLESVLTDPDLATFAFFYLEGAYVELGFVDNIVSNRPGFDLALYEYGSTADSFELTIEGVTQIVPSSDTGYLALPYGATAPTHVNLALVDLDDFGLEFGDTTDSVVIWPIIGGTPLLAVVAALPVTPVQIDLWPRSSTNRINPRRGGEVPLALLTTAEFDVATVDPMSVRLGPNGAMPVRDAAWMQDVDRDGDLDLMLHFLIQETGVACGDTELILQGATLEGTAIEGTDSVQTIGCK
jgi:hypothetical protein